MLKQAKERIQGASASCTIETAMSTRERALFAFDKPKFKSSSQGRDAGLCRGFRRRDSRAKGKPTGGNVGILAINLVQLSFQLVCGWRLVRWQ
jgi:hypothetical protein